MPTKRSASSSSSPRPHWSAYSSARSRLSSPARIDSARTAESSRRTSGRDRAGRRSRPAAAAARCRRATTRRDRATFLQPRRGIGQLALVDEQPGLGLARGDLVHDLVERHLARGKVTDRKPQREERGRHAARNGDLDPPQVVVGQRLARDDDRPVAGAHARAVREQDVAILDERVRVQRDRRHLEPALERPLVQRLDVLQDVLELEAARIDLARGEAPEHEGVVGIRAVAEPDLLADRRRVRRTSARAARAAPCA